MDKDTLRDADDPSSAHARSARAENVGAGDVLRALADYVRDSLTLLVLEGRLAIISLITMAAAGIFVGLLAVSAWLFLLAAIAVWLVTLGCPWAAVLLGIAAANCGLGLLCSLLMLRLSRNLLFTETRRNLGFHGARSPRDAQVDAT